MYFEGIGDIALKSLRTPKDSDLGDEARMMDGWQQERKLDESIEQDKRRSGWSFFCVYVKRREE